MQEITILFVSLLCFANAAPCFYNQSAGISPNPGTCAGTL